MRTLKQKLKLKTVALQQQEKTLLDLEKETHSMGKTEEVRKTELKDGQERVDRKFKSIGIE